MLGDIIKRGRLKKKITQLELANYVGTNKSTVFTWEKNKCIPSGEMLIKIIEKLEIVDELFPKKEERDEYQERFERIEQEIKDLKNIISLLLEKVQETKSNS